MNERVPEGWAISNLDDAIDILSGFPFKSSEFTNDPSDFGLIRIRNLLGQELETFYSGEYSDDFVVQVGDILIGMDGDFHIVKWKSKNALLNQRICKLVPKQGGFDINFVHYFLIPELQKIHNQTTATTVKHLSVKDIREVEQAFPPLPEQKKIASILTSVDDVIETTQKQIDKLQDLKKATMNELLTKGIGHTEFKDSELGRIPKSWEVKTIEELSSKVGSGVTPRGGSSVYQERGVLFIRSQNVHFDGLKLNDAAYISDTIHAGMQGSKVFGGDVLLNITGASIGRCAVVADEFPESNVNQHVCIIRPINSLNNHFLGLWLSSDFGQGQIMRFQAGGNREGLNFEQIRSMSLPFPTLSEQKQCAKVVTAIQSSINEFQQKLSQTQALKKSLMQDLLTGKVRVQVN